MIYLSNLKNKRYTNIIRYKVRDAKCIGCDCFIPVWTDLPKTSGTKQVHGFGICETLHLHGCPEQIGYSDELKMHRIENGWYSRVF